MRGGVRRDAVLADLAADRDHLGDAGNGQQPRPHHEVGDLAHLHRARRVSLVTAISMISPMIEVIGPICGRDAGGKLLAHQREPLGDQLAVAVDVGAPVELDIDDRQADARDRAHARYAGHAVHLRLDREGDELLDLLRREALGLGHHGDGRAVEVGKDVDRQCAAAVNAP